MKKGDRVIITNEAFCQEPEEGIVSRDFGSLVEVRISGEHSAVIPKGDVTVMFDNCPNCTVFPNGFDSWYETHHEIVEDIVLKLDKLYSKYVPKVLVQVSEDQGTGGIYELAKRWTDEFEETHKDKEWEGEYFDAIEEFLTKKYNDPNGRTKKNQPRHTSRSTRVTQRRSTKIRR